MSQFAFLALNDFRLVFRDAMLRSLLLAPFLVFGLLLWLVPLINTRFPDFVPYNYLVLIGGLMQSGILFGFINGFMFLEEKDEHVFTVLRTVPISARAFVASRLTLGVLLAFAYNFLILYGTRLIQISIGEASLVAFQLALITPILALSLVNFAQNKVEGFAHFKIYNLVLDLPLLIYFLPSKLFHVLAIIPTYWSFRSIEMIAKGQEFGLFYGLGTLCYMLFIGILLRIFERRVF